MDLIMDINVKKDNLIQREPERKNENFLIKVGRTLVYFILFWILLPILVVISSIIWIYRLRIHYSIKRKYGTRFIKFLSGSDAFHAIENSVAKSVVNFMIFVEINKEDYLNKFRDIPTELLETARKQFSPDVFATDNIRKKIFYKLNTESGYAFWTNDNQCTMNEYIRFLPDVSANQHKLNAIRRLQETLSNICNNPLPGNHTASWELLISKEFIEDETLEEDEIVLLPIICRFNHTLGDGVSIIRLIVDTIADKDGSDELLGDLINRLRPNYSINRYNNSLNNSSILKIKYYLLDILDKFLIFLNLPVSLFDLVMLRERDKNVLHGSNLSGEKIISWYFEKPEDNNVIKQIKGIKNDLSGVRFSDVFITAVSNSLESYFDRKGKPMPDQVTSCIPLRIAPEEITLKLQNKFSSGKQVIPIKSFARKDSVKRYQSKLMQIKECGDAFRKTPILVITHYCMSLMCALLPLKIVKKFAHNSLDCTLFISNIPGPDKPKRWNGLRIGNAIFYVQNIGETGLGLSLLSYNGKIQLGLMADKVVINNLADADFLLSEIVKEIHQMSDVYQNSRGNILVYEV